MGMPIITPSVDFLLTLNQRFYSSVQSHTNILAYGRIDVLREAMHGMWQDDESPADPVSGWNRWPTAHTQRLAARGPGPAA